MEPLASSMELQATLDAAFELIDDCLSPSASSSVVAAFSQLDAQCQDGSNDDTSTSSQSSPPSSPSPSQFDGAKSSMALTGRLSTTNKQVKRRGGQAGSAKAPTPAPKRATFQVRQKQEIAQLRQETAELETALGLLRALTDGTSGALVMTAGSKGTSRPELASLWKDMAARHKKLRGVSEAENMTLRLQVAEQLKAIRSIQKLLRRQATRDVEPVPRPVNIVRTDTPEARGATMAMLSDEIDAMYGILDASLEMCGLGEFVAVPVQGRLAQPSPTSFAAQIVESRLMPFNFRDVAETLWDFSMNTCTNSEFFEKQSAVQTGGALFRTYEILVGPEQLTGHHSIPGHDFNVKGNHGLRKFVEPNRHVFLNSGFVRPTSIRSKAVSGVFCRETGRVVISRVPQATGSVSDLCCVQTCFEIVVDVEEASAGGKALAKDFRGLLMAHKMESFDFFQTTLEGLLLRKQRPGKLAATASNA